MPYLLRELVQGTDKLACVRPDCPVKQALKIMIDSDYSQLPVTDESGVLKGLISEQSIVRTQALIDADLTLPRMNPGDSQATYGPPACVNA